MNSYMFCLLMVCAAFENEVEEIAEMTNPHLPAPSSSSISHHGIIEPKVYHPRSKRHITNTAGEDGLHLQELHLGYTLDGQEHVLELRLNRELVGADFFIKYQHLGGHAVNKPTHKEVDLCQYVGTVRGMDNSWAALSTCRGLRGVVYDGKSMHYLQPQHEDVYRLDAPHFLYKHHHLVSNHTCGYVGSSLPFHTHSPSHSAADINFKQANRMLRYKRSVGKEAPIRQPYNANKHSRYLELEFVVDKKLYDKLGKNLTTVHHHCKDIANMLNTYFLELNIFIALTGVVVWSEQNEISVTANYSTTLAQFADYREKVLNVQHPSDNSQLLSAQGFSDGIVGYAFVGTICHQRSSSGINFYKSVPNIVAILAHEMGHNLGFQHDADVKNCSCPAKHCVMSGSSLPWSSCSKKALANTYKNKKDRCLRNKPLMLFDSPVCGNGFVEPGEQCDCGMGEACRNNHCCDPNTCMLFPNATCATGECCQKDSCRPSPAGTLCRSADHECDLPEYCTGHSEFCPSDVFKMGTHTCDKGKPCVGKQCENRKKSPVQPIAEDGSVCPLNCSDHGVCNSLGHCHCELGFNPPLCQLPGPGGSVDSGPAQDPNVPYVVRNTIFSIFLGVVPLLVLLMMLGYYVRHGACFWGRQHAEHPKQHTHTHKHISSVKLISTTNQHVNNNFAAYKTPVIDLNNKITKNQTNIERETRRIFDQNYYVTNQKFVDKNKRKFDVNINIKSSNFKSNKVPHTADKAVCSTEASVSVKELRDKLFPGANKTTPSVNLNRNHL